MVVATSFNVPVLRIWTREILIWRNPEDNFVTLCQEDEPLVGEGKLGWVLLSFNIFKCVLLLIWTFFKNNFTFNDHLEYSHLISHFSICNTGVTPICTKSIMPVFLYFYGRWRWGYLFLLTLYSRSLIPCLSGTWQDLKICSLSEHSGFCDHPFKSLLLNIARVVSTVSLTSAEGPIKSQSNLLAHWCLSQLKQTQQLFIGGIIYGPRTLLRKRQCSATKVNTGLSTSCRKKDKSQELTKHTE